MLEITPIAPRESAVDLCARQLREAILSGEVTAGTRLPPERRLAESFGVNRVTVRSALAQLAKAGLVSVRQGSGYVVHDFRHQGGPDLLGGIATLAAREGELATMVEDLLLVRRQLARGVLERLAACGAVESEPIERALSTFGQAAAEHASDLELARHDVAVLAAVVDATGSAVLRLTLNPVLAVLTSVPAMRAAIYADPSDNVAGYRVLLAWLEQRDASAIATIVAELERRDRRTVDTIRHSETKP